MASLLVKAKPYSAASRKPAVKFDVAPIEIKNSHKRDMEEVKQAEMESDEYLQRLDELEMAITFIKKCYCRQPLSIEHLFINKKGQPALICPNEENSCGFYLAKDYGQACKCHPVAKYHVVKKNSQNKGKAFLNCGRQSNIRNTKGCGFFRWLEPKEPVKGQS